MIYLHFCQIKVANKHTPPHELQRTKTEREGFTANELQYHIHWLDLLLPILLFRSERKGRGRIEKVEKKKRK